MNLPNRRCRAANLPASLILAAFAGCAASPHVLTREERAICHDFSLDCSAGFPGLSEEDRIMWTSGALHQPTCEMDAEGEVRCE